MTDTPLINASNLSRYYGPNCAVNDISFKLQRGQILGFLGPNGAGKSSTMQMLTGNLAASKGTIQIQGIDLCKHPVKAKTNIGYLPETPPLYDNLTVDEYLRFCGQIHKLKEPALNQAVTKVKTQCDLHTMSKRLIGNLSKGFQQRVGIAQAIIHDPDIIILDEPTVGLDPVQIRTIRDLIKDLGKNHGIILSTHILPEVQAICSHVQIIHYGKLVLTDTIDGLLKQMGISAITIGLRHPPNRAELAAVPGIEQIETLPNNRFHLIHNIDTNPTEALLTKAVNDNWGLFELVPKARSLEQLFIQLVSRPESDEVINK